MDIKNWIRQIRPELKDDAILIRKQLFNGKEQTHITILNVACCVPALVIDKSLKQVTESDIINLSHLINHSH